jgi:hypothetical protein
MPYAGGQGPVDALPELQPQQPGNFAGWASPVLNDGRLSGGPVHIPDPVTEAPDGGRTITVHKRGKGGGGSTVGAGISKKARAEVPPAVKQSKWFTTIDAPNEDPQNYGGGRGGRGGALSKDGVRQMGALDLSHLFR